MGFASLVSSAVQWFTGATRLRNVRVAIVLHENGRHAPVQELEDAISCLVASFGATHRKLSPFEALMMWQVATGSRHVSLSDLHIAIVGTVFVEEGEAPLGRNRLRIEVIVVTGDGAWFGSDKISKTWPPAQGCERALKNCLKTILGRISLITRKNQTYVRYRRQKQVWLKRVRS